MGYRIAVFPLSGLYAATFAIKEVFSELKKTGTTKERRKMMVTFEDFNKFVDLKRYMALEKRYIWINSGPHTADFKIKNKNIKQG